MTGYVVKGISDILTAQVIEAERNADIPDSSPWFEVKGLACKWLWDQLKVEESRFSRISSYYSRLAYDFTSRANTVKFTIAPQAYGCPKKYGSDNHWPKDWD